MLHYDPNHHDIARMLRGDDMLQMVGSVAEAGAEYAQSIAPVETGEYAGDFETTAEVLDERATGILYNTSDHGALVEWGFDRQEGHHVLARTADWIEAETQ